MSNDGYGIKPEWREAWAYSNKWQNPQIIERRIADLAVHLLAALMQERFKREHGLDGRQGLVWCLQCNYGDVHRTAPPDPRHNYIYADWLAAAKGWFER